MSFFKEIFSYFRFRKIIKNLEIHSNLWKTFEFNSGWFKQFGAIIKIYRQDVVNNTGSFDEAFVKMHILTYLEPFIDELKVNRLYDALTVKIDPIYVPDVKDYVFYKITFWYYISERTRNIIKYFIIFLATTILANIYYEDILKLFI
jgi:hypothetical protein